MKDNLQIMLIELEAQEAEFIANSLIQTKDFLCDITIADNFEAGLKLIDSSVSAVLAILDIKAVKESNSSITDKLMELSVPYIILTDLENEELAQKYLLAGAHDYIIKENWCSRTLNRSIIYVLHKQKMNKLRQTTDETPYTNIVKNFYSIAYQQDSLGNRRISYGRCKEITGYDQSVFNSGQLKWSDIIHPEDVEIVSLESNKLSNLSGYSTALEYRIICANNEEKWVSDSAYNLFTDRFEIVTHGLINDISDKRKSEKQLVEYANDIELKNEELDIIYKKINEELNKAFLLHQQFLPSSVSIINGISMAVYFQPAERIGGDFYNVLHIGNQLLFYIVDVSGHGLDGAMLNIFIREKINSYLSAHSELNKTISPKALLEHIDHQYRQENFPEEYMVCILAGALDLETNIITFANAEIQIYPLIVNKENKINKLVCNGLPITRVIDQSLIEYNEVSAHFPHYTTLLITTDGIVEEVVNNIQYDVERLKSLLFENHHLPPEIIANIIKQDFINFAGKEQGEDDITIMIVQNIPIIEQLTLAVDSSLEGIDAALDKLSDFLALHYNNLDYFSIGLYEIITNAAEHGNGFISGKKVVIMATVAQTYLKIVVEDEGDGFDWRNIDYRINHSSPYEERGRGILIAKMCFDFLQFYESGNRVCLIGLLEPRKLQERHK